MPVASLIPELQAALQQRSGEKRSEALRKITGLFIERAGRFNDDHVRLFDQIFIALLPDVDNKARQELSRRLAPIENSPLETIRRLASDDDMQVAGPALAQSSRLSADDLVEIASSKGVEHLCAISGRPNLEIQVTDMLIRRGDSEVRRELAGNAGAKISESGFTALIRDAEHDNGLAEALALRIDFPESTFRDLISRETGALHHRLLAIARDGMRNQPPAKFERSSDETGSARPARDFSAAREKIQAIVEAGELSETKLAGIAQSEAYDDTVAALSALTMVPVEVVDRLMIGERPDPILILCRAAGYSWPTAREIVAARTRGRGEAGTAIESAHLNFDRLSESTAKRVVRFWQMSPGSLKAAG